MKLEGWCRGRHCHGLVPWKMFLQVNASKSGVVKDMSKLEQLIKRENVVWAKPLTRVGNKARMSSEDVQRISVRRWDLLMDCPPGCWDTWSV